MKGFDNFYHQEILDALRVRICTTPPTQSFRLRENDLADEFEVSRSPIRQVLQILARQHLVIIKPSVGASVTMLEPARKADCFRIYQGIAAIAETVVQPGDVPQRVKVELAAANGIVHSVPELTPEIYVTALVKMHTSLASLVEDQIIHDALLSSVFRMLRWRAEMVQANPAALTEQVRAHIAGISAAGQNNTCLGLLQAVAQTTTKVTKETRMAG